MYDEYQIVHLVITCMWFTTAQDFHINVAQMIYILWNKYYFDFPPYILNMFSWMPYDNYF